MLRRFSQDQFRRTDNWLFFKDILLSENFDLKRKMKISKLQLRTVTNRVTVLIFLYSAILSSNIINCDQQVNNQTTFSAMQTLSESISTAATLPTTTTTTAATTTTTTLPPSTNALDQPDSNNITVNSNQTILVIDYKQHPNPASSDSSTKLSYDRQHEQQVTTLAPSASSPSTPESRTGDATNKSSEMAQTTTATAATLAPSTNKSLEADKNDVSKMFSEMVSNATTIEKKTHVDNVDSAYTDLVNGNVFTGTGGVGESSLISDGQSVGDYLVASDSAALPTSSALDDTTLDLDSASTSASVISRHGRASSPSSSPSSSGNTVYVPPASSRLSHYSPGMLLQNSRTHNSNSAVNQHESNSQQRHPTTLIQQYQPKPNTPFDPIIVCYLGSWSVYRPSLAKFTPENINPFLCTHIIYAFAGLSSKYELKPFDSYNDITQGGYRKFTGLKDYNKQLKTLIAVGGWNEGSAR